MKVREQKWAPDEQSLVGTIANLALGQPAMPRTFRAFRDHKAAIRFVANMKKRERRPRLSCVKYSERDTFYVVNYRGSNKRDRVKLAASRVIMSAGIITDRLVPSIVNKSTREFFAETCA